MYIAKMDNRVLLLNFERRHKYLVDLVYNPIRLIYYEEIPLDRSFIKDFVGGRNVKCEVMFGTSNEFNIQAKMMSISNNDFEVDTDEGIIRRGRIQNYTSKFVDDDIDEDNHIYKKIEGFENKFDDEYYKNAYFHLLLNYIDELYIPQINKDEFKQKAEDGNVILNDIL